MSMPYPISQSSLPPNTVVPESWALFIPYFNRLYEDVAFTMNQKDDNFYQIAVTSSPVNITLLPQFGAYIVCVSGTSTDLPTLTASLCKSSSTGAGSITPLGAQNGSGAIWAGVTLTITSTTTNFQIQHSLSGVTGAFNIRVIGTQG